MEKRIWSIGAGAFVGAGIVALTVGSTYGRVIGGFALIVGLLSSIVLYRRNNS